jgi:hypothetical protein
MNEIISYFDVGLCGFILDLRIEKKVSIGLRGDKYAGAKM